MRVKRLSTNVALRMRAARPSWVVVSGALAVVLGLGGPAIDDGATAWAQAPVDAQPAPGFLLERFVPAVAGSQWFGAESLDFRGNLRPALRATLSHSHRPFVLVAGDGSSSSSSIVGRQTFLHLGLALNLWDHVRAAVDLPVALSQSGTTSPPVEGVVYLGPGGETVGDVRATLDFRLFGKAGAPFALAIGMHAFFPTEAGRYTSDGFVRFMPRVMAAGDVGRLSYAVNLGFLSRDQIDGVWFGGAGVGHELTFAAAVGARPHPRVLVGAELLGATAVSEGDVFAKRRSPIDLIFGAHLNLPRGVSASLGAGPGVTPSKGSPALRVLARLQWIGDFVPDDSDGDGIVDDDDACGLVPGPPNDIAKMRGCPVDPDRDHDRIDDVVDACPEDPGVVSPNAALHGCPPPRDRDGDGVFDPADACPDRAGGKTDDPATNGCAVLDSDHDGLADAEDACPGLAGARGDGPQITGCPDTDGDGVRDPQDVCPDLAGPRDVDPSRNGCPAARIVGSQVQIREQIRFRLGSAKLLPESFSILTSVATLLKQHPEVAHVRVEGHTDNRGGKSMNLRLSAARAAAVKRWLTTVGGIDPARVSSVGLGMERPLPEHADNATEEGRAANRRVEFHIARPVPDAAAPVP